MKRQDFVNALKLVMAGAGESGLGGPAVVVFDKGWIRSLNDKISISNKFETGIDGMAIPIDKLYGVLEKMKGDEVTVTQDEEDKVQFKCGRTKLKLVKVVGDDLDKIMEKMNALNLDKMNWIPIPAKLSEGLKMSLFSAEDSEIGRLSGVVISEGFVVSTDNYRISMFDMGKLLEEHLNLKGIIRVKTSSVSNLVGLKLTFDSVGTSEKWFSLKSKDNLFVSVKQLPLSDYPLDEVIGVFDQTVFDEGKIYELPNDLEELIERAELLAGVGTGELSYDTMITLRSEGGNLIVTGTSSIGEVEDSIPWVGELPTLTVSPRFLKSVLQITRSFKTTPAKSMVLFETPGFKFLMIARVE